MEILVRTLSPDELDAYKVYTWPIWNKEVSEFDWYYENTEDCLLLKGRVEVRTSNGKVICFGAGQYVTFPQGLSCRWKILEPVSKHYRFR